MSAYDLTKLRVLVIDDSRYMIKIIHALLESMDVHTVRGIDCGADVFKEIAVWEPDMIITDQVMEKQQGLEIIRSIRDREDATCRYIPIILLTGHAHHTVVTKARFTAGADAVLAKPVSAQRLFNCIVSLYESNRTFVSVSNYFGPDRRVRDRPFEGLNRRDDLPAEPRRPQLVEVKESRPAPAPAQAPVKPAQAPVKGEEDGDFDLDLEFVAAREKAEITNAAPVTPGQGRRR